MTRNERREALKAEAYAATNPTLSARMLAGLHRAASTRSQQQIEQIIGRLGLWGHIVERNRALVAVEG